MDVWGVDDMVICRAGPTKFLHDVSHPKLRFDLDIKAANALAERVVAVLLAIDRVVGFQRPLCASKAEAQENEQQREEVHG